jgi:hypothetical protein
MPITFSGVTILSGVSTGVGVARNSLAAATFSS